MLEKKNHILEIILIGLSLIIYLGMQLDLAWKHSATSDEPVHLLSGYLALTRHDFSIDPEHPYLVKELTALPLLFQDIKFPDGLDQLLDKSHNYFYDVRREGIAFADQWLNATGNNQEQMIFTSRLPIIFLNMLLGMAMYLIAKRYFGRAAGLLALFLWLLEPSLMAHSNLVNTDVPVVFFCLLAIFAWGEFLRNYNFKILGLKFGKSKQNGETSTPAVSPGEDKAKAAKNSRTWFWATAVFFALTSFTKFSFISLIPIMGFMAIARIFSKGEMEVSRFLRQLVRFFVLALVILGVMFLILWLGYFFPSWPDHTLLDRVHDLEPYWMNEGRFFRWVPLPPQFLKGFWLVQRDIFLKRSGYLLGQVRPGGWWYYFPIAMLVKTTIPLLILLFWSFIVRLRRKRTLAWTELCLLIPPVIFLALGMIGKMNIGLRHIFSVYPFIIIWVAGFLGSQLATFYTILRRRRGETIARFGKKVSLYLGPGAIMFLLFWMGITFSRQYPYIFSYFNEFIGSQKGWEVLSDSNIDWGQDAKDIRDFLDAKHILEPYCSYFWSRAQLHYFGVDCLYVDDPSQIGEGFFLIDTMKYFDPRFDSLREKEPKWRIKDTIFVYEF